MPLAKLRQDYTPTPSAAPAPQLSTDLEGLKAAPSPALALQQQLAQRAIATPAPRFSRNGRRAAAWR